jgi:hypothetical protein
MKDFKEALLSTLCHALELVVVFAVVYLVLTAFKLPLNETITSLILATLVKFLRTYEKIPLADYVNK